VRNKVAVVACGQNSQLLRAFPSVVHSERTLSILDQTKHATNPDQHTARIQRVQASPPEMVDLYALVGRHSDEACVENASRYDEAGKEQNLDHETADDDVLASRHSRRVSGGHDTSACECQYKEHER